MTDDGIPTHWSSHCPFPVDSFDMISTFIFFFYFFFSFYLFNFVTHMPSSDNDSPPPTVDDFMESSALAVSPILTSSIFDEIYIQPAALDADTLAISENNNPHDLSRPRHHRRSHLAEQDTSFVPPPPSARWRRRLARVVRSVATSDPVDESNNDDDDYEDNSSGDENDYNHIGPVMPSNDQGFPRSASSHFIYGQNCLNERAVNTSPLCNIDGENNSNMLDFDVVFDDGGQYG